MTKKRPWHQFYSTVPETIDYPEITMYESVMQSVKQVPDQVAWDFMGTLCTSARVPDHVVYAIAKELFDNFDHFKGQHPAYAGLTKAGMLEGLTAPLHPGAVKYFREAGLLR